MTNYVEYLPYTYCYFDILLVRFLHRRQTRDPGESAVVPVQSNRLKAQEKSMFQFMSEGKKKTGIPA